MRRLLCAAAALALACAVPVWPAQAEPPAREPSPRVSLRSVSEVFNTSSTADGGVFNDPSAFEKRLGSRRHGGFHSVHHGHHNYHPVHPSYHHNYHPVHPSYHHNYHPIHPSYHHGYH